MLWRIRVWVTSSAPFRSALKSDRMEAQDREALPSNRSYLAWPVRTTAACQLLVSLLQWDSPSVHKDHGQQTIAHHYTCITPMYAHHTYVRTSRRCTYTQVPPVLDLYRHNQDEQTLSSYQILWNLILQANYTSPISFWNHALFISSLYIHQSCSLPYSGRSLKGLVLSNTYICIDSYTIYTEDLCYWLLVFSSH